MKTMIKQVMILLVFVLFGITVSRAQPIEKEETREETFEREMYWAFSSMVLNAKEKKKETKCEVEQMMGLAAIPDGGQLMNFESVFPFLETMGDDLEGHMKEHSFDTHYEAILSVIGRVRTFEEFVDELSDLPVEDLALGVKSKFKRYYAVLKYLSNHWMKSGKVNSYVTGGCWTEARYDLKVIRYAYPLIHWDIRTTVSISCDCEVMVSPRFDNATYVYRGSAVGTVTKRHVTFGKVANPTLELVSHHCCD